ncbi:MAG: phosphatase PAP2 family protein [Rickettsiales bacterium]
MFANLGDFKNFFYDWGGLNEWLFLQINSLRGGTYDTVMLLITKLGDHKIFPYVLIGLLGYVFVASIFRKLSGRGAIKPRLVMWFGIFTVLIAGFAVNGLFTIYAKDYFEYERPYVALESKDVHLLEPQEIDDDKRSFPSGHVGFITFLIISLWPAFRDDWKWYSLLVVAAVGWTRVSLGVHYPADVLWSFLFTTTIIITVRAVTYTILRKLFNVVC